ncbi:ADP-dependent (S)-NAD(P)H-hydrate dehydratase [Philodulcilactobacillus myokoensis]|uniref:ADP-dependent (S)-NAD(P)H-hydrate dehydratase n=1 Tax=Philodulcilactobacillus myokoensis TaxID=2929573 RepID=A0A9W6B0W7_9LACO|nr:NAD(P)H-hydrate dehydratase [Philodulcilactobacillus myokoensis]GLB46721.1 ADP-dependent (S)-NAD(P)H-hydrate dehydratase [Philodulcilactobacillus myokoensis]
MKSITEDLIRNTIRIRPNQSHKGTYGRVTLVGGNQNMGGAIIMATTAAVYSGAGLVSTLTDMHNLSSLHSRLPEAMVANILDSNQIKKLIPGANVVVVGPGLGTDDQSKNILQLTLQNVQPNQIVIIDGSAITMVAQDKIKLPKAHIIFTPHQMEWQRLSGIKIADQKNQNLNQKVRDKLNAIVVLKSHHTQIYTSKDTFINPGGTPAQATGGMGDTLAGMIAGFTAQFKNTENAVLAAVYAHSAIADKLAERRYVVLPHQIAERIPFFMHNYQSFK